MQHLLTLAADRSRSARGELFNTITDYFLPTLDQLSDHERALMTDVLGKLIGTIEIDIRLKLSEVLARGHVKAVEIERLLAHDAAEVARPLLEGSTLLRDADLIEVVKARTDAHRMSIALREPLSPDVADALVAYSGPDVLEVLLRNKEASLSRAAMEYLVAESKAEDRFQEPLLDRNDLPADLACRMFWWVSAALRRRILESVDMDAASVDALVEEATCAVLMTHDEALGPQSKALKLAGQMLEMGELTDAFLVRCLRQRRLTLFTAALAVRGQIGFRLAWQIVTDRGSESLLVLCRALELESQALVSIVLLLAEALAGKSGSGVRKPAVVTPLLRLYTTLTVTKARQVLQLWQRDGRYQEGIAALEDASVRCDALKDKEYSWPTEIQVTR